MEVCRAYRNNGSCRYGDECKYEHSEGEPSAPPPRGECYNWKETGECEFGERCRFLHGADDPRFGANGMRVRTGKSLAELCLPCGDQPDANGVRVKKKKTRPRRRPRRIPEGREKLDEVCNNYLAGRCRYGDNCRRQHVGDVELKPVEKIDEICRNFQEGRCRFGDLCRRQHVAKAT